MMSDYIIAPFCALEGTDMKRVSQFDIYLLGSVRSLSFLRAGQTVVQDDLVLNYLALNSFCNDELSNRLLPTAVTEAKHLRTVVERSISIRAGLVGCQIHM
jgi:hypothetical protein